VALRQLWSLVQREALTMSFSDTFVLICAGFVVAACLVPLLPRPATVAPAPPADAH
jgi:DHA2 family multidrug resistance protein